YEVTEAKSRQTLSLRKKVLGPEHPNTLWSVYFLACLLSKQRRVDESLPLHQRGSAGYEKVLGKDHPTTI
ncbi:hypothetical protein PSV09DRAFT_1069046, partial [Bipolaris maydis]